MIKLMRYLKPFSIMVFFILIFAFFQALADLNLPNVMSDIINNGIQRNGIETAVPMAIRKGEFDKISLFLDDSEKSFVLENYILQDKNSSSKEDFDKYVKDYKILENEPIYILNTKDKETIDSLDKIMGRGILSVSSINKLVEDNGVPGVLKMFSEQNPNAQEAPQMPIDPNADIFTILSKTLEHMTPEQSEKMRDTVSEKMKDLPDSMISQAATSYITDEYKALGVDMNKYQQGYILRMGGFMLLISAGSMLCTLLVSFLSSRTAMGFGRDVGRALFTHVESFSLSEFDKVGTASLITRNTNDITQVQNAVMMIFRMMITAPMMCIGGIIMAVMKSRGLSWLILVVIPILLVVIVTFASIAIPYFKKMQVLTDKLNLVIREKLMGIRVIRAFNREDYEGKRFDTANVNLVNNAMKIFRIVAFMMPIMMLLMNGTTLSILWFGAKSIDAGSIQIGDMMAFMQYMMQILMSFMMLTMMFVMLPRAQASAVRINEVFAVDPKISDAKETVKLYSDAKNCTLEFKDVTFSYPGAESPALRNISFKSKSGEITAIIGSTGCGKSTLVNLIPRFYDIDSGAIEIDGVDIRKVSQEDLRHKIGFVPQKATLFSGTILENIRYGKEDAKEEEVEKAAEISQALDFISEKEEGFETYISQGGTNVSGGQKQRLSIARALVRKPDIYVFDDSFSALDFKTDANLRAALKKEVKDAMLIIVAQRVSTVMDADRIMVLEGGEIVGMGTHKELLDTCKTYKEIVSSQFSEGEIA